MSMSRRFGFDSRIVRFELYSFLRRKVFNEDPVLKVLPTKGKVLDLGCGYGTLGFQLVQSGNYSITGIDRERRCISTAETVVSARNVGGLHFICTDVLEFLIGSHESYDIVLAIDLFHHVQKGYHVRMIGLIYDSLRPGGTFILKDIGLLPRYKYLINFVHDSILNRSIRLHCRDVSEWMRIMEDSGFITDHFSISSALYPHFILRGTKTEE